MSNAKRPSAARKVTRSTENNRNAALDDGVRIEVGEDVYEVRVGDLNALDDMALRKQVGVPFTDLMEMLTKAPGLDLIAAIVWLARRIKGERDLTFEAVAVDIGYDFLDQAEITETKAEEIADGPEA